VFDLGLWTASFNLGAFTGPTSAGFMVELWSFRTTTIFYCCIYVFMIIVDTAQLLHGHCTSSKRKGQYEEIS